MADPIVKFVFQDATGSSSPVVDAPVSGGGASRVRPPPRDDAAREQGGGAAGRTSSPIERAIDALGNRIDRIPFFGQAIRILGDIAGHTKAFESFRRGAGGILRELLGQFFGGAGAAAATSIFRRAPVVDQWLGRDRQERDDVIRRPDLRNVPRLEGGGRAAQNAGNGPASDPNVIEGEFERVDVPRLPGPPGSAGGARPPVPPAGGAAAGEAAGAAASRTLITTAPASGGGAAGGAAGGALTTAGTAGTGIGTAAAGGAGGGAAAGAAAAGSAIPIGLAIAGGVVAIGGLILVTRALIGVNERLKANFAEVAERLRPFSGQLQGSQVRIEIEQLKLDIENAKRLGQRVGTFQEEQSRISRAWQRIYAIIEGPILDVLNPILKGVAFISETLAFGFGVLETIKDGILNPIKALKNIGQELLGIQKSKALSLPPEADILSAFSARPYLTVTYGGRVYGDDGRADFSDQDVRLVNPAPRRFR